MALKQSKKYLTLRLKKLKNNPEENEKLIKKLERRLRKVEK